MILKMNNSTEEEIDEVDKLANTAKKNAFYSFLTIIATLALIMNFYYSYSGDKPIFKIFHSINIHWVWFALFYSTVAGYF